MRCHHTCLAVALGALLVPVSVATAPHNARAQSGTAPGEASPAARVEFDHPGAGSATVEVDLPAGMLSDLVGLGDAAVAGVAEALQGAQLSGDVQAEVKLANEQLAAVRAIVASLQGAVGEVRVRIYEGDSDIPVDAAAVTEHYSQKLQGSAWDKIVSVREDDDSATVFLVRDAGAVRGVFVVVTDGSDLVLANVLCDVSPDRIKQITRQATSMGLELGGEQALRELGREMRRHGAVSEPAAVSVSR
jgi:hypothetical protein